MKTWLLAKKKEACCRQPPPIWASVGGARMYKCSRLRETFPLAEVAAAARPIAFNTVEHLLLW